MTTDDRDRLYRLEQIAMSRLLSWRTAMQLSPYLAAMVAGMVVGCYAEPRSGQGLDRPAVQRVLAAAGRGRLGSRAGTERLGRCRARSHHQHLAQRHVPVTDTDFRATAPPAHSPIGCALHADHKHDQPGHRNINATIGLKVPIDVALSITDFSIVTQFVAEYRGVAEYDWLAFNRHRLGCLKYVVERSLTKTVVHEYEHAA
jgi:hypothetical protein